MISNLINKDAGLFGPWMTARKPQHKYFEDNKTKSTWGNNSHADTNGHNQSRFQILSIVQETEGKDLDLEQQGVFVSLGSPGPNALERLAQKNKKPTHNRPRDNESQKLG